MNERRNVAFLSTYPPRECGLATFTEDLVNEINKVALVRPYVVAVAAGKEEYEDSRVGYRLSQHDHESYLRAAHWVNSYIDLLVIEHEYGIFGGECGEYIIDLVKNLKIPFVVTTHTVLEEPSTKQQAVLRELGQLSTKLVTMAESSVPILAGTYGITPGKIVVIPHGVPSLLVGAREKLKVSYDLKDKHVISSFGLLSPAKGLEYGIEAVAKVVADFANVVYLILGKTHPYVRQGIGESYRQSLMDLAEGLGVRDNVRFVDKYLTKEEVIKYLHLSDIYMTPYLSKEQAVSGTLAYAVGCGRVVVSTPYRYAQEMLGDGRGMLAEFRDSDSLASCVSYILRNPFRKKEMELKTLAVGRMMTWDNVARRYTQLFIRIIEGFHPGGALVG
ncbi:D-inositol-3-phosphate glycosyltransferase [Sporomusa rhizae]|uniref:glycosyltransferase family 4 protein n=1 Tax=Sporomusa rhizae TaxID=357999 RepID=UPI00352ADC09